jgi:hypothetical protein
MSEWAVRLAAKDALEAAKIRLEGASILEAGETIWIRGRGDPDQEKIRSISCDGRYRLQDELFFLPGDLLPSGRLPQGEWIALELWLRPRPQAAMGARKPGRVALAVVRSSLQREAGAVLCGIAEWKRFAAAAAEARLSRLRFAADARGRVIARGRPVAAIGGVSLVDDQGVMVPCGWAWDPPIQAAAIREMMGTSREDAVVFDEEGAVEVIRAVSFVAATREGARRTK